MAKFRRGLLSSRDHRKHGAPTAAKRAVCPHRFGFQHVAFSRHCIPAIHWAYGAGSDIILSSLYHNLSTGLITVTIAFFLLEHILQKKLAPHFFPNGGLHAIPKTLRIRIRTRLAALLFACNLIPLISIILGSYQYQRQFFRPTDRSGTIALGNHYQCCRFHHYRYIFDRAGS